MTRAGQLYVPDVWLKLERKTFRLELEAAAVFGSMENRALRAEDAGDPALSQALQVVQFGGAAQGEIRWPEYNLKLEVETGFASGDRAPGMGNKPRRRVSGSDNNTQSGDIDGPQYACQSTGGCSDSTVRNFRFNRDYRIDMILWREIVGGGTDAVYLKPKHTYVAADGFELYGAIIGSRAVYAESTPSSTDPNLGIELDAGARYITEDGFMAGVAWGILFPMGGLANTQVADPQPLENPQAVRALMGIKF